MRRIDTYPMPFGNEVRLQSLTGKEMLKAFASDANSVLIAACYAVIDDKGHTLHSPTPDGIDELIEETCQDDAALLNSLMGLVQYHVFGEGEKKVSPTTESLPSESRAATDGQTLMSSSTS